MKERLYHLFQQLKLVEWVFIITLTVVIGIVWLGFFFEDPYIFSQSRLASPMLWSVRIIVPLLLVGILFIYYQVRTRRIEIVNISLLLGSLCLVFIISYPIANHFYLRTMDLRDKADLYHPYLQLAPVSFPTDQGSTENQIRIMCLGGSTTEFKDSKGKGWPGRVQENLEQQLNTKNIQVFNMGRQWYTTLHSVINYEVNLRQHKPDVLIVMHTINDLLHNADFSYFSHGDFREDYGHFYGPVNRIIERKSLWQSTWNMLGHFWYYPPREIVEQDNFPGLIPFERNLNTLIDLTEKDGTRVVLLTQPSLYHSDLAEDSKPALYMLKYEAVGPDSRWSYTTALRGFEAYRAVVQRVAEERGVTLIDLESHIPKTLAYFYDDVHYRDQTFDLVADVVTRGLIENNVLPDLSSD